ncbi:autotransporter outer membrane beta-barrel domain-containing protein [Achromobacter sp. NCFB-sbj8-Ac1-l]|uniref:autotransporter outer membrane beta-barrel domain-containing protein n=1 Tax=unclassified Achromobacter TaxID=2626865 RepID=UPI0040469400
MNIAYRIIWSAAVQGWVVVSELATSRGKSRSTLRATRRAALAAGAAGALTLAGMPLEAFANTVYTPGSANNGAQSLDVNGSTVNLDGTVSFSGSSGTQVATPTLSEGFNAGWVTGAADPAGKQILNFGAQNAGVTVTDPITSGSVVVNTYDSSRFTDDLISQVYRVYWPTQPGAGAFVNASLAKVSGGGTFNMNATGQVGDFTSKNVNYVAVTNGTANWNSRNEIAFADRGSVVTQDSIQPYTVQLGTTTYNGTFTVTTSDGAQSRSVTNLAELKAYNTWLVGQLRAGKLGAGAAAQTAYNNALNLAYTKTVLTYTINPATSPIDPSDPMFTPVGNQVGMLADGAQATARVTSTGAMTSAFNSNGGTLLRAVNGGTVINEGTVSTVRFGTGMSAASGGHIINNGVRNLGEQGVNPNPEVKPDIVTGVATTYVNNGTINQAAWTWSASAGVDTNWINVNAGAVATNNGAVNIGTRAQTGLGKPVGAIVNNGGTLVNGTDGLIYLGREGSTNVTAAVIDRGGADVAQINGAIGITLNTGATARNNGNIIIGDKVQAGRAVSATGTGVTYSGSGTIEVKGHYNAAPLANVGIYSTATASNIDNAGTINVKGANSIGIQAMSGGQAKSSGTINVSSDSAQQTSGLRNYGVWSEGTGSNVAVSGAVNLTGDGTIGVRAQNGGGATLTGSGAVNFQNGKNQIGFFIYGAASSIIATGTAVQDVSTEGSTLFRVEDGADFTGGTGAGTQVTASGKNSTAVYSTGFTNWKVSAFNSGDMTINLEGEGAVGVRIEGGAQGKISQNAVINMNDEEAIGAVAGIADGQKRDVTGANVGSPQLGVLRDSTKAAGETGFGTGTILVTGATLNSALDGVTGYIARNGAELSNSGNIVFTGSGSTGISVQGGSRGGNTGRITVGAGGVGIRAQDDASGQATVVNTSGDLVLNGGDLSHRAVGINASGANTTVNMTGGNIHMNGTGAVGVVALNGASVNLSGTAMPIFASGATGQILFRLSGAGSSINTHLSAGTVFDASAEDSTLYRLDDGAALNGRIQVAVSGEKAQGIYASGVGTSVTVASGSQFDLSGAGAQGLYVSGGAQATVASGAVMNQTNAGATAGLVDGNFYSLDGSTLLASNTGSTLTNGASLTSTQAGAVGFITQNLGILVNNGSLQFSGAGSQAVRVVGGELRNTGNIQAKGTAIYVEGAGARVDNQRGQIVATDGRAAVELGSGASLDLVGSGLGSIEGRGTAHAVLVSAGATALNVQGAHLVVNAAGATGNGIENAGEISGIQLANTTIDVADGIGLRTGATISATNSGLITVSGSGAGIAFQAADGSQISNSLDLSDSQGLTIRATGAGGRGVVANTTGTVNTAVNVSIQHTAGGSALVLGDGVTTVVNGGVLRSNSRVAPTVATNKVTHFTNSASGEVNAPNGGGTALVFDDQATTLVNLGRIAGLVDLGAGNNVLQNRGTIDGDVRADAGDNTLSLDGGTVTGNVRLVGATGSNTLLLKDGSSIGALLGSSGNDTVTVQGAGNQFSSLDGGAGNDTLVFDGARYTLSDSNVIRSFDQVRLRNASTLTLQTALAGKPASGAAIDLDGEQTVLALKPTIVGNVTLGNVLTGNGLVQVDAGTHAFDFASSVGNAFRGTVAIDRGTFLLGGDNATALTNATLRMGAGNTTSVGNGVQSVGGLAFDGGTLIFNAQVPGQTTAPGSIRVGTLDASGAGTVRVTVPTTLVTTAPGTPNAQNLLAQDDANTSIKLVAAGTTVGSAGAVAFQDQNGTAISAARELDISVAGDVVAKGTYDFRLTTAPGDGLYVNYGLTKLELQDGKTLALAQDDGATGADADLSAKLTGRGGIAVAAGNGVVSLSNATSDYQGATAVQSGTLRLDASGALGRTQALRVSANAAVDLNGKTQAIGAWDMQSGSSFDFNGGALTLLGGGTTQGRLAGAGTLTLAGSGATGTHVFNGANPGLAVRTLIGSDATAVLDNGAGLGSGEIVADGTLQFKAGSGTLVNPLTGAGNVALTDASRIGLAGDNRGFSGNLSTAAGTTLTASTAANLGTANIANAGTLVLDTPSDWTLENAISGTGDLTKRGGGRLTASDASLAYTGRTTVEAGTLVFGGPAQPDAFLGGVGAGTVTVGAGASLVGDGTIRGAVVNHGALGVFNALDNRRAATPGTLTLANGLTNAGTLYVAGGTLGNTLRVQGDYVGQGGAIVLAAFKGDDTSASDKLVLDGGRASGNTGLVIRHAGGTGDQTSVGIPLVLTENGATTDATAFHLDARSDGYRQGVGSIATGAYDYNLARGGVGGNAQDWYLVSQVSTWQPVDPVTPVDPVDPVTPVTPVDPTQPVAPVTPTPTPKPDAGHQNYRPEVGAYLNNRLAATTLQQHTLRDRGDYASGSVDGQPARAGWVRIVRGQDSRDGAGTIKDTSTTYLIHGGSDLLRFPVGKDGSARVGAMASYGSNSSRAESNGLHATGKVEGYAVGVYGTWFGHTDILTGPYVDTWMMLGRYDNKVDGQGLPRESYRSRANSASVETGYSFKVYDNGARQLYLQPQAQAIVTRYQADDHQEKTGTRISGQSDTSVATRVGVRLQGHLSNEEGATQMLPFAEVNWWHGPSSQRIRFDQTTVRETLPGNQMELKAGLQGSLSKSLSLSGSLALEAGSSNYTGARGQLNLRYMW